MCIVYYTILCTDLQTALFRQLCQINPSLRPSAKQLLSDGVIFQSKEETISRLESELAEKNSEILRLRELLNSQKNSVPN